MALTRTLAIAAALVAILYVTVPNPRSRLGSLHSLKDDTIPYSVDLYPGGHDLTLPAGTMRYYVFGPTTGQKVVLVHGLSIPSPIWYKVAMNLTANGAQVLLYDIWGRGYSDSPGTRFDEHLYISQLAQLLQKIGWDREPFTLMGVSMGGAIATSFTRFYPELVKRLVLIAPAGLMSKNDFPLIARLTSFPFVSQLVTTPIGSLILRSSVRHISRDYQDVANYDQETQEQMQLVNQITMYQAQYHPGFFRALVGTTTDFPLFGLDERFQRVGEEPQRPVLVFWGDKDLTSPYKYSAKLKEYIPHARIVTIERGGHGIAITNFKEINEILLPFLKE